MMGHLESVMDVIDNLRRLFYVIHSDSCNLKWVLNIYILIYQKRFKGLTYIYM